MRLANVVRGDDVGDFADMDGMLVRVPKMESLDYLPSGDERMTMDISLAFPKEPRPLAELIDALKQAPPAAKYWIETIQATPPTEVRARSIHDRTDWGGMLTRIVIETPPPETAA